MFTTLASLNISYPIDPKNGAFIQKRNVKFMTLYNAILDTYGIYKVDKDWGFMFWEPPDHYVYPEIDWESIWIEMDYSLHGYKRNYQYSITINGPEIYFHTPKL